MRKFIVVGLLMLSVGVGWGQKSCPKGLACTGGWSSGIVSGMCSMEHPCICTKTGTDKIIPCGRDQELPSKPAAKPCEITGDYRVDCPHKSDADNKANQERFIDYSAGDYAADEYCLSNSNPSAEGLDPKTCIHCGDTAGELLSPDVYGRIGIDEAGDDGPSTPQDSRYFKGMTHPESAADKNYYFIHHPSDAVSVSSPDMKFVRLPDAEYTHLQEVRKAVVDEEKRLAVKYGAVVEAFAEGDRYFPSQEKIIHADHYEYHGQFLLIEKAKP